MGVQTDQADLADRLRAAEGESARALDRVLEASAEASRLQNRALGLAVEVSGAEAKWRAAIEEHEALSREARRLERELGLQMNADERGCAEEGA
jgi:hypothetical protein